MSIYLRDFAAPNRMVAFDAQRGETKPLSEEESQRMIRASGFVAKLGRETVSLYLAGGSLRLSIGEESFDLRGVSTTFGGEGLRALELRRGDEVVTRLTYPNPVNPPMSFDFTLGEEEDFDFGLFVHNVLSSAERVHHLAERWSA